MGPKGSAIQWASGLTLFLWIPHIQSNTEIFDWELSAEDLAALDKCAEDNYCTGSLHKSDD